MVWPKYYKHYNQPHLLHWLFASEATSKVKGNANSCPTYHLINNSDLKINSLTPEENKAIDETPVNLIYTTLTADEKVDYADTYLQGDAGKQDFFFLLDELNAYANGLDASIVLPA